MDLVHLLQSISVIMACISIIVGVDAWRREYIGKRKIELAEDVLTHFYQARDAVRRIRNPWQFNEGKSRKPGEYESSTEKEILDRAYVVFERFEKEQDLFNKLEVVRYRFMARFGAKTNEPFDGLRSIINEIFISANRLGKHYWPRQGRVSMSADEFKKHVDEMEKHEAVFWEGASREDPINPKLDRVIERIEQICRPIIEEKSGVGSLLVRNFFWKQ